MSFANLPLGWVLAGLAALAAGLFLLQRLRVRHREVTVVTTLFWNEAVQEARARVLVDRFRHPLAYLLVLLIAALLWAGVAGPQAGSDDGRDHYVLLDASAGMAWGDRFDAAREGLTEVVAAHPRAHTTVVVCGSRPRTVLLPGESELLLERRMEGVVPEASPETISRTIREIVHAAGDDRPTRVHVVGDGGPDAHDVAGLRVTREPTTLREGDNRGVTRLGISEAASGDWTAVDVFAEVRGTPAPTVGDVEVSTDDGLFIYEVDATGDDLLRLIVRDVPADGRVLTVQVTGSDALRLDDVASVVLPTRTRIRVAVPDDAPPALRAVLEHDPAVRVVAATDNADVVVTRDLDFPVPALVLMRESDGGDAFVLAGLPRALDETWRELALDRIDATSLATAAGREISVGSASVSVPQIRVWESLFGDGYEFTGQRAFPAFVAQSVRVLADVDDVVPVTAAGRELPHALAPLRAPDGTPLDPADGALVPQAAGSHVAADGSRIEVSLLDETTTLGTLRPDTGDDAPTDAPGPADLTLWAGLLACVLLAAEWVLHKSERIP